MLRLVGLKMLGNGLGRQSFSSSASSCSDLVELALATRSIREFRGESSMTHICAQSGHLFYKESLARCLNEVESLETCVLRTDNRSQEQFIAEIDLQCVSPLVGRSTTITVGRTFAHQGEKMQAEHITYRCLDNSRNHCSQAKCTCPFRFLTA